MNFNIQVEVMIDANVDGLMGKWTSRWMNELPENRIPISRNA